MVWTELVVAIMGIAVGGGVLTEIAKAISKVWAHKENIARIENGLAPIGVKGGGRGKIAAVETRREGFTEYDEARGN